MDPPRLIESDNWNMSIDNNVMQGPLGNIYGYGLGGRSKQIASIIITNSPDMDYINEIADDGNEFDIAIMDSNSTMILMGCQVSDIELKHKNSIHVRIHFSAISVAGKICDRVKVPLKDREITIDPNIYTKVKNNYGNPREMSFDEFCKYAVVESL